MSGLLLRCLAAWDGDRLGKKKLELGARTGLDRGPSEQLSDWSTSSAMAALGG